jgi:hypothetical protein
VSVNQQNASLLPTPPLSDPPLMPAHVSLAHLSQVDFESLVASVVMDKGFPDLVIRFVHLLITADLYYECVDEANRWAAQIEGTAVIVNDDIKVILLPLQLSYCTEKLEMRCHYLYNML